MFAELKGPLGGTGEGRIQNTVACFLALNIHFHLARLARQADPVSFRPPTDTMRRVYGLQTLCGVCKVLVMVGSPEQLKSKSKGRTGIADDPGRGQAHAEGSAAGQNAEQGTSGESDAEDPLDLKSLVSCPSPPGLAPRICSAHVDAIASRSSWTVLFIIVDAITSLAPATSTRRLSRHCGQATCLIHPPSLPSFLSCKSSRRKPSNDST